MRWWIPGGLLLAAVAAWLGWHASMPAERVVLASSLRAGSAAASGAVAVANAASPPPSTPPAASRVEAAGESTEICGAGRVTEQQAENWKEGQLHALEQRKQAALSRLSARLAAGSDSERVAARLIMGDWEGGARVAAASQDGAAYRLALSACAGRLSSPAAPSCGRLSALTWVQLDPEDSGPWMRLFGDAMQKRDEAAATEAMEQVLKRHRRSPGSPLVLAVDAARSAVDDVAGLGLAVVEVIGLEAAQPDSSYAGLGRYCGAAAVKDGARRARCERFARWQLEQADTVMDALAAVGVADRVGLPADQRPFTREQLNQGLQRLAGQSLSGYDCAGLARAAQWPTLLSQRNGLQMALQPAGSP